MNFFTRSNKRIYLDHASATPLGKSVHKAMTKALRDISFGNPSSVHEEGRTAKFFLQEARAKIAASLSVKKEEIVFTSGGTEANNLAILGVGRKFYKTHKVVITTAIEHSSTLEPINDLANWGVRVEKLSIGEGGLINPEEVKKLLNEGVMLISLSYVNSEIGTIAPIREIGTIIREFKKEKNLAIHEPPFFHIDASQASELLFLHPHDLGVDLMTLDASKVYGPKGVGVLYVRSGIVIEKIMRGGGQEDGRRAGTENVIGAIGFAEALEYADLNKKKEYARLLSLKRYAKEKLSEAFPQALFNGLDSKQLPSYINICFPGVDAEFLAVILDGKGIAVSSASACRSISEEGSSYVISSLPGRENCAKSSLRISMGRFTTSHSIDTFIEVLKSALKQEALRIAK